MESSYKEIKILPPDSEAADIVVKVEEDTEGGSEPVAQEEPVQVAPVEPVVEQPKVQRESRAQKRIRELHAASREKDDIIAQERREKAELQKQLLQGHVSTKESFKVNLEGSIKSLGSQITAAMNSGNAELAVQLQEQWMNSKMQLQALDQELSTSQQEIKRAESVAAQRPQVQNQVPEKALDWIEDHPEFNTDPIFNGAAIATNNQLLREGFDPASEEFYAEINKRLQGHFPKVFGVEAGNSVQLSSNNKVTDSSTVQPDVKEVAAVVQATTKVRTVEQVVSGSSRPSANTIPQRKTTEVTLSAQDVKQAEAWGWSLERMAKRIMHIEKNKKENGYVPISIN